MAGVAASVVHLLLCLPFSSSVDGVASLLGGVSGHGASPCPMIPVALAQSVGLLYRSTPSAPRPTFIPLLLSSLSGMSAIIGGRAVVWADGWSLLLPCGLRVVPSPWGRRWSPPCGRRWCSLLRPSRLQARACKVANRTGVSWPRGPASCLFEYFTWVVSGLACREGADGPSMGLLLVLADASHSVPLGQKWSKKVFFL